MMGAWGYWAWPSEPYEDEFAAAEYYAEMESLDEFVDREVSYEEAMAEDIASDEGGWGGRDFEG